jgi:hypothetical protein
VRFIGGAEVLLCGDTGARGDSWAFNTSGDGATVLVRFPKAPSGSRTPTEYDENYLRKLYVYVELTSNYEILPEELADGCAVQGTCEPPGFRVQ